MRKDTNLSGLERKLGLIDEIASQTGGKVNEEQLRSIRIGEEISGTRLFCFGDYHFFVRETDNGPDGNKYEITTGYQDCVGLACKSLIAPKPIEKVFDRYNQILNRLGALYVVPQGKVLYYYIEHSQNNPNNTVSGRMPIHFNAGLALPRSCFEKGTLLAEGETITYQVSFWRENDFVNGYWEPPKNYSLRNENGIGVEKQEVKR